MDHRGQRAPSARLPLTVLPQNGAVMSKLLSFIGATVVGSLGWWIGAQVGFMTAFFVSMIGTGVGIYVGRRIARDYLL